MNDELPTAYPLSWPVARPRTPAHRRMRAKFGKKTTTRVAVSFDHYVQNKKELSMADAVERLLGELDRLNAVRPVVSTNVALRLDGLPRANQRRPEDPGAAVYFRWRGAAYVMACDRWDRPEDNIAAVAAHIGALRGIERWGVVDAEEAFSGFKALPAIGETIRTGPPPYEVLGFADPSEMSIQSIGAAFRKKAHEHHPDKGGDPARWEELVAAKKAAELEVNRR